MNKKAIAKIGAIGVFGVLLLAILVFVVLPLISSQNQIKSQYFLGEKIKIDIPPDGTYKIKIEAPYGTFVHEATGSILFNPEAVGKYMVNIGNVQYVFEVIEESQSDERTFVSSVTNAINSLFKGEETELFDHEFSDLNDVSNRVFFYEEKIRFNFRSYGNYELLITLPDGSKISRVGGTDVFTLTLNKIGSYELELWRGGGASKYFFEVIDMESSQQPEIEVGKEVEWKKISTAKVIEIPGASNISVFDQNTGNPVGFNVVERDGKKFIEIDPSFKGSFELTYFTQAPLKTEREISVKEKEVTISAPDILGYEDVKASSEINEVTKFNNEILVYWKEENKYVDFQSFDSDADGFVDRVEWVVPYLSNQTFNIIVINRAEHLDSDRAFIENVYGEVSVRDFVYKNIPGDNYVRVWFERNLTSTNDITIYAKSNDSASVEVYEKDSNVKIADFGVISGDEKYQIILNDLNGSQDIFDLRVVGGSVEFDLIIDPTSTYQISTDGEPVATGTGSGLPTGGKNIVRLNDNNLVAYWEDDSNDPTCSLSSTNGVSWGGVSSLAVGGSSAYDMAIATNGTSIVYLAMDYSGADDVGYIIRNTNTCDVASGTFADVSGMTNNYRADISYDSSHSTYVVCSLEISGSGQDLDFAYASVGTSLSWTGVDNAGTTGTYEACSLDANSGGNVFIAIDDSGNTDVTVFNSSAGTFASSSSVTAYNTAVNDIHLSIRVNEILITAVDSNSDLVVINSSNNGTSYTSTVLAGTYSEAEGCIDAYGVYHLAVSDGADIDYIQFSNGRFGDFFTIDDTANALRYPSVRCSNFPSNNRMDANELELVYTDVDGTAIYFANFTVPVNSSVFGSPQVSIVSPTNSTYGTSAIQFNFSLNEPGISCNYSITNGAVNISMTANSTNTGFNATNSSVPDGFYTVRAYCADYAGNSNLTVSTNFSVSTVGAPGIIISSPSNGSTLADVTPILNITTNGTATAIWYGYGGQNTSICTSNCSAGNYSLTLYLNESSFNITVYSNISTGGLSSNSTDIIIDMNSNYYDTFGDNTSLLTSMMNNVSWYLGSVNFSSTISNIFSDGFEVDLSNWAATNWGLDTGRFSSGAQSVLASNGNEGNFDSDSMNTSLADFINVSFWYNEDDLEDQDIDVYFYDGISYDLVDQFGADQGTEDTWYFKTYTTSDSQYMHSNFSIRFTATLGNGERIWIDDVNITYAPFNGNFTVFNANLSSNIIEFTNISWNTAGTYENNNITIQVSTDNGGNWYTASNGQGLTGVASGNRLVYRTLFSTNDTNTNLSLLDVNITWSDVYSPVPNVTINTPGSGATTDVSPTLNVTIDGPATSLFYNINDGSNITICTDCSAGDKVLYLYLYEGNYTINVYAADIFNNQNSDSVSITIETNNNHFDNYTDNSSLDGGTNNNVSWSLGNISLNASLVYRTAVDDNFNDGSYTDNDPTNWTAVSNAAGCSWSIVSGIMTESSGCDDADRDGNAFGGYIYPGNKTWTNVNFTTTIRNSDNDGVGVMFRYINDSNYYRVRFEGTSDYRRLERIQGGVVTVLDSDSLADGGLTQGTWFTLKVSANGNLINVYLDGTNVLTATDSALGYGSVALYSWDSDTGSFGADFDEVLVENLGTISANFTAYKVNVSETITAISNVTWDESGTDSGNNTVSIEVSANGGNNWHSATKNQPLTLTATGSSLLYRALFTSNKTTPVSLSNFNISWSSVAPSIVNVSINSPSNGSTLADVTPTLNVTIDGTANTLWYNLNNGANTTICTSCTGVKTLYLYLYEGDFNLKVYVNNSAGVVRSNNTNFTIDLNNNYYDTFNDNSSLLSNQTNNVNWYSGLVNYFSSISNVFNDGFESGLGNWQAVGGWDIVSDRFYAGSSSVRTDNGNEGNLDSNDIDTTNWTAINVTFYYNDQLMDPGADIGIYFYNGSVYNLVAEFGADNTPEDTWYFKNYSTSSAQYLISNFRVRFAATPEGGESLWIDQFNVTPYSLGNYTAYKINVTSAITTITNITWSQSGVSGTNISAVELSFSGGFSWLNTTNGQGLSGFTSNASMLYRVLFSSRGYANMSLLDINISWSAAPSVEIIYPLATIYSSTVTRLNYSAISGGGSPSACWWTNNSGVTNYTVTCGQNITTVSSQGNNTWTVYANDTSGALGQDSVTFTIDTSAPNLTFINQTNEDGENVTASNPLEQGENLTIYANVSDDSVDDVWVVIWQTVVGGAEKTKIFFTYIAGFLWKAIIPTDTTWDLLNYNYTIYANDTSNLTSNYTGNFSMLNLNSSISLSPNPSPGTGNVTIYGTVNYSNGTVLANHPINLFLDGSFLWFSNLTAIGSYSFYQNKTDTALSDFNEGNFYQTQASGGSVIIGPGNTSGNYTNILDAGARVDWDIFTWDYSGQSCNTTLSWQEGNQSFSGTSDVYIDAITPNTNYEATESIFVDTSPTQRALLKFDIFGNGGRKVPYNSTITMANITIDVVDTGDTVNVYEILENWTESQVTYNNRLTGTAWSSTGVANTPSRSAATEGPFTPSTLGANNFSILNAMRVWVNQSRSNYGVVLNPGGTNVLEFSSSEDPTQANRPILTVSFNSSDCTNLVMSVRLSNNGITWTSWQDISNGSFINDSSSQYRYLQYRAEMGAINSTTTPILQAVIANYSAIVTNSSGKFVYNVSSPSSFGTYSFKMNTSLRTMFTNSTASLSVQAGVAPNVSLVSPSTGTWFNYSNFNLSYNASDVNDDLYNATLIINGLVNASNSTPISNGGYSNFSINFSGGQYNWSVNVTDSLSYSANTTNRSFYIDLQNPVISLVYPPNATNYSASSLNLSFNVTDNMDSSLTCDVVLDGSTIHSGVSVSNATNVNYSSGSLTTGQHNWNVTCVDESSRRNTSSTYQFNITDLPPAVYLYSPANSYLDSDGNISFLFNVSEDIGIINCSLIINQTYYVLNQSEIFIDVVDLNQIDVSNLIEGNYNWTVGCYDTNLNYFENSSLRNFSVDLYSPQITLNLPSNLSTVSTSDPYFNFTVIDNRDSSLSCNLTVSSYGTDSFSATNGSLTNRQILNLVDGNKSWNVSCIDDALHLNTTTTRIVNIAEPPNIFINTTNGTFFSSGLVTIEYTPYDNTNLSSCTIYLNGVANNSNTSAVINSQLNEIDLLGLADGAYDYYVNCSDYVPLSSISSINRFYVDQVAPTINLSFPNGDSVFATNVTFNYTVTDAVDSSLVCNLSIDGVVEDPNFPATNNTLVSRDIPDVTDGFHTWYVNCSDSSANNGNSLVYNFTRSTAPDVSLILPSSGQWLNYSPFNLTYYIQDDQGFSISYLIINGSINRTNSSVLVSDQNNTFNISDFSDGIYNWTVIATDLGGINGTDSSRIFYLDRAAPQISLNSPGDLANVTNNNVTINYTVTDNLDTSIFCQLYLDGSSEDSSNVTNATNKVLYQLIPDGNHIWYVNCTDEAGNGNVTSSRNFTVEAPPVVNLTSPPNNNITSASSLNLTYVPYDPIGITQCNLILDGVLNDTSFAVSPNQNNTFVVNGISEGQHNWTVNCSDPDGNWNWSTEWFFTRDLTPPNITLNTPQNDSGIYFGLGSVTFEWVATDSADTVLRCNLTIDGINNKTNLLLTSGIPRSENIGPFSQGGHTWNVSCWDRSLNVNYSETRIFNYTYPDFLVNATSLVFGNSSPNEGTNVSINVTVYNLGGANISLVNVSLYDGIRGVVGTSQIGSNVSLNLLKYGTNSTAFYWSADVGTSQIYVEVDPPLASNGIYTEWNESNNNASANISVGSWHFFYGNVATDTNFSLSDSSNKSLVVWGADNFQQGNIFATDSESIVSWPSVLPLGKNVSLVNTSNDFSDSDAMLNMTGFNDSITNLYLNGSEIRNLTSVLIFNKLVQNIPIANSINNSNFVTGILWDSSDDVADGEFSQDDREDLIFLGRVNKNNQGAYGIYDYEIRIPVKIRSYSSSNSLSAVFYLEVT
ncbi:MAG TPA: hypothetical protein VJH92_04730 [Candidatus Nanoarchaeia archaeon]|nr:hypothetical protein [Candidatus Nanoarchaeia archaeon]